MNSKRTVQVGDIFATPLPMNKYGAVKVMNIINHSYLLSITSYIGEQIPTIESKGIHHILITESIADGVEKPLFEWTNGRVPRELIFIGNVSLTADEIGVESNIYAGEWTKECGIDVYYKWREETDPIGFELEMKSQIEEADAYARKHSVSKPKKMMDDQLFWEIISLLDWRKEDEKEIIEAAVKELYTFTAWKIRHFEETLSYKLFLLDTEEHAKEMGEYRFSQQDQHFSPDLFLYARCAVVARGKEVFEDVLSNPSKMIKDTEFETLLSLSSEAYYLKMGKEFEYESGCSYETFSNKEGWSNNL
ncbi:DUF4240 domain-containing protein [Priestia aryabhattai]|uniref:DUF4240 domain-containing protein n=1 Tax=Priestia TaxID=2800373 RepID=UPI0009D6B963|nr:MULTISPECIES: DUF4240 domain-containing protein [Priestia]MBY0095153.1 DUF4240 domain-containing protein [Priestia aryabhattai]MBY0105498.1 DUF4240 domain-containing protein [Priestia aryabhattai]MCM3308677.1 DUF4240 domain-containing protein [Priestia megaterium]